jgi:hypothetical protein
MKYFLKSETILSEDTATQPKDIRFQKCDEITELVTLVDGGGDSKTYPIGAHSIDMGNVAEGRWLYLISDQEITFSLSGGAALTTIPDKPIAMWVKFTSLDLTTTVASRITVAIAGE